MRASRPSRVRPAVASTIGVVFAAIELGEARLDVAAQQDHLEPGMALEHLRLRGAGSRCRRWRLQAFP